MEISMRIRHDVDGAACPLDIVVSAPPGARFSDLLPELSRLGVGSARHARWYARHPRGPGAHAIELDAPLGSGVLLEGTELTTEPEPSRSTPRRGLVELCVCAGPDSGHVLPLAPGVHTVGRSASADIRLQGVDVSRLHLEIVVDHNSVRVRDLESANGTWVNGAPLTRACSVGPADRIRIGQSVLRIRTDQVTRVSVTEDHLGHLVVVRGPRHLASHQPVLLETPQPAPTRTHRGIPVTAIVVPLVAAAAMALLLHNPSMLLFGVLSPVMAVSSRLTDGRAGRRAGVVALAAYERQRQHYERALRTALDFERARLDRGAPDLAEVRDQIQAPGSRLWERSRGDPDFLRLRVGIGVVPADVRITGASAEDTPPHLVDAPVDVSLVDTGSLGVAGPRLVVQAAVRALLAQLAAWHSPRVVRVVVLLARAEYHADWAWLRWLPHARAAGPPDRAQVVDIEQQRERVARQVAELCDMALAREADRSANGSTRPDEPTTVVVLDGSDEISRHVTRVADLLAYGAATGIHLLCIDVERRRLPARVGAQLVLCEARSGSLTPVGGNPLAVQVDGAAMPWAESVARAMAGLRDGTADAAPALPGAVRLLDLLPVDATDPDQLAGLWARAPRSTAAYVGLASDGPCLLDLARDGPHALIGGTTGSGKSALLETLVASLAVVNRPDELCFVLIDYKGGAAFTECARLPHTVGLVTDLDSHLAERALISLRSELKRREHVLAEAGARDLEELQGLRGSPGGPLPRLVIIIDEFRALAEELPDFVSGLVRIAALGRSLGIHLVLATQRPGGIVSADIRANVSLRIALRVRDRIDSEDVIDAPDAARLPADRPGRALARGAGGSLLTFQTAHAAAPAPGSDAGRVHVRPWSTSPDGTTADTSFSGAGPATAPGANAPGASVQGEAGTPLRCTQVRASVPVSELQRLVDALTAASLAVGASAPPSPWLSPLPLVATTPAELPPPGPDAASTASPTAHGALGGSERWPPGAFSPVPYARIDLPDRQAQLHQSWDLRTDGHLSIVGDARSGRTTAARTLAATLAATNDPHDVQLYVFDGSGAFGVLERLPHTAALIGRDELARGRRLVARLAEEVVRRQAVLARAGLGSIQEQRLAADAPDRLCYLVVVVDTWDAFVAAHEPRDHGSTAEAMVRLLRDGQAVGVRAVLTGDRLLLRGSVASAVANRIYLRLSDPTDLALAGLSPRLLPKVMTPGRGVRSSDGAELQILLLDSDTSTVAQTQAMRRVVDAWRARPRPSIDVPRVNRLPVRVLLSEVTKAQHAPGTRDGRSGETLTVATTTSSGTAAGRGSSGTSGVPGAPDSSPRPVLIGLGGDEPAAVEVGSLSRCGNFLVLGAPRSGRSNTLAALAVQLVSAGRRVVVVEEPTRRSLGSVIDRWGLDFPSSDVGLVVTASTLDTTWNHLGGAVQNLSVRAPKSSGRRSASSPIQVLTPSADTELARLLDSDPATIVVVDDVGRLTDCPAGDRLTTHARSAATGRGGVICAASAAELAGAFRGVAVQVARHGAGIVLNPSSPSDGDPFGVRVPTDGDRVPGRGLLLQNGQLLAVQVASPCCLMSIPPGRSRRCLV